MTETILEIKNLKNHTEKMKSSKISPSASKRGRLSQLLVLQVQGNQPSFALLTYSNHLQVVKSSIMETTSLKKVTTSLPIVKDSVWFSNLSTSLKTLMFWKMLS